MDRFDQADHSGALHQGYALTVHHRKAAAAIIAVQLDFDLGEVFVIQGNGQADLLLLRGLLIGKFLCNQGLQRGLEISNLQFVFLLIGPGARISILLSGKGVIVPLQRNVELLDRKSVV